MANIINPYRYVVSGGGDSGGGGGDYVAITTSDATIVDEQFTYYDEYTYQNETISTGFKYAIFNGSGSINVTSKGTSSGSTTVDWLIIAGGGAGGNTGYISGGGGAGGYREGTTTLTNTGSGSITVGAGGPAAVSSGVSNGNNSSVTFPSISAISSTGGGGGATRNGSVNDDAGDGGSGGGADGGFNSAGSGNDGGYSPSEGHDGGDNYSGASYRGAGGGGAGEDGKNSSSSGGGDGGAGKWSAISGFAFTQRGGGGGGGVARNLIGASHPFGSGGAGGGGNGAGYHTVSSYNVNAETGSANTGGGGGGGPNGYSGTTSGNYGSTGGSGVVILRWQASASNYPLIALPSGTSFSNDDYDTDYLYAEFDSSDYFHVLHGGNSSGSDSIEAYVIGGGGGGGENQGQTSVAGNQGGGGAGGYIRQTSFKNGDDLKSIYNVTIGAGGATSADGSDSQVVKQGERSIEFDGSNDYLETGSTSDFNFGTGDFCIEFWMNPAQVASSYELLIATENSSGARWQIYQESAAISFWGYNSSGTYVRTATAASAVAANKWHHVAVTRNSGTLTIFVDGKSEATSTSYSSYDFSDDDGLTVGAYSTGTYHYEGKMLGVRVVNGSAVYTAAFNPPMEKLTAITNTKLLINPTTSQSTWTDSSASGHTLTGSGWTNFSSSLDSDTPLMRGFGGGSGGAYNQTSTSSGNGASACGWNGGSGGGGGYYFTTNYGKIGHPGQGFSGQGNDGGKGPHNTTSPYAGGGGGGAGAAGDGGSYYGDGDGGAGHEESWMSSLMSPLGDYGYFAGGGGGGQSSASSTTSGGSGGGGAGGYNSANGSDGSTNTGGGGGGAGKNSGYDGGSGGSGKVILRWKFRN